MAGAYYTFKLKLFIMSLAHHLAQEILTLQDREEVREPLTYNKLMSYEIETLQDIKRKYQREYLDFNALFQNDDQYGYQNY